MRKVTLLLLAFMLLSVATGCRGKAESSNVDTQVAVNSLAALADSHIQSYVSPLEGLTLTPQVQSADWQQMAGSLGRVAGRESAATVWFVLPDGSYYTAAEGKVDANLSDRDYFPKVMAGSKVIGSLVVSRSSGRKSAVVVVPVVKNGKVVGGLGTSIFLEDLSRVLSQELQLPEDRVFYAITADNQVALHSDPAMIMAENPDLPKNVNWRTSSLTGWRFALGTR